MSEQRLTLQESIDFRKDTRNKITPFKIVQKGLMQPLRFQTEKQALDYFRTAKGTCVLSYNTDLKVKILAYKFR